MKYIFHCGSQDPFTRDLPGDLAARKAADASNVVRMVTTENERVVWRRVEPPPKLLGDLTNWLDRPK